LVKAKKNLEVMGNGYKNGEEVDKITFMIVLQECPTSGSVPVFGTKFNILSLQL
jgi:hypothetical protein